MPSDFDPKLESLIDEELKKLPPVAAPSSLASGVMSILTARTSLPWWQRSWWDWPLAAKAAFLLIAVSLAGVMSGGAFFVSDGAVEYSGQITERFYFIHGFWESLAPLHDAALLVWQKTAQQVWWYAAVAAGALYLMCLGMGTACYRYALKRA